MKHPLTAPALVLAAAACLAACGDDPRPGAGQRFVADVRAVDARLRSLADVVPRTPPAPVSIGNDQLFAWAQLAYPELFPGQPETFANVAYQGKLFSGQAFANGNYLAVADGEAYGLGPFTNQQLTRFGPIQTYAALVCAQVDCGRSAPLNACAPPAGEVLRTSSRTVTTHVVTQLRPVASTREVTTESLVDGPVSFAGGEAMRVTQTQRDGQGGVVGADAVYSYRRADEAGLIRTLGTETVASGGGPTTRVLFEPALANTEFTLQPGQTLTQVQSLSTSVGTQPAVLSRSARTHTFEARERIEVLGRSYDTCRYREVALGTSAPVKITWAIAGSALAARTEWRDGTGAVTERSELKAGSVNGAPLSPGQATLDAASADRLINDYSYVLPICSPGGAARAAAPSLAQAARRALDLRKVARVMAAQHPRRKALAYTATRPADQLGDCGGRLSFPSYAHANGVTTATMRWDDYCTRDPETGDVQILNGSWSFVESGRPGTAGPVVTRYEGGSNADIQVVDRDRNGRALGSQSIAVVGYVSIPGVPGGDPTPSNPDRLQAAEWQVRNLVTGKLYRQTDYRATIHLTPDGAEHTSFSGRGYRNSGYFDLRTTAPLVSDADGNYLSGVLSSTGADGSTVVMTVVPGETLQATMTVGGTPVTTAPACR